MASPDWRFARRPSWLLSHAFALTVVATFVVLGLWQLDRLDQRQATNALIAERSRRPAQSVGATLDTLASPEDADFVPVADRGAYLAADQVIVRNRSQNGAAGSWVVTPLVTESGRTILVNRGFVPEVMAEPRDIPVPEGPVEVTGWLRRTQERSGLGPRDAEAGTLRALARLDVARIDAQVPADLAPVWLQLDEQQPPPPGGLPDPVPLPELDEGNHLSYALQWFIFAVLGVIVYVLMLRRRAHEHGGQRRARDQIAA